MSDLEKAVKKIMKNVEEEMVRMKDIQVVIDELNCKFKTMSMCLNYEDCKRHNQNLALHISLLEELKQYRSIGTVDECKAAIEKQN